MTTRTTLLVAARSNGWKNRIRLLALLCPLYGLGCGIAERTVQELDDEGQGAAPAHGDTSAHGGATSGRPVSGGRAQGGTPSGVAAGPAVGGMPSGGMPSGGMPSGGMPSGGMVGAAGQAVVQPEQPTTLASDQQGPQNLAVDATHAYWANHDGARVMRVALGGGLPQVVAENQLHAYAVAIDREHAYFTTYEAGGIRRTLLAGGEVQALADDEKMPSTIAVDETHVYWSNSVAGAGGGIRRLQLEGGQPVTFAEDDNAGNVLLDADNVYWTTSSGVKKQGKAGGVAQLLASTSASSGATLSGDYLYWVHDGVVARVTKDGLKREDLVTTAPFTQGVAADATTVYFATSSGQVMRAALALPKPYPVAFNQNNPKLAASDAAFVYWIEVVASGARIQRFAK